MIVQNGGTRALCARLFYAQGVTAISQITASQVQAGDDGIVWLQLGRVPVRLPEPAASIALAVVANRKGHATIGAARPAARHCSSSRPRFPPRSSPAPSTSAPTSLPPWPRLSAGDWAAYAADVSRRPQQQPAQPAELSPNDTS